IKDGGEMPEVAFNSSLYYLTQDEDGPRFNLNQTDLAVLKAAVVQRFRIIVLRDLQSENRRKTIYRGLNRSYANWFRLVRYCSKERIDFSDVQPEIAEALVIFLMTELYDVCVQGAESCVNCTQANLKEYAKSLDVDLDTVVNGWRQLF
ncbi:MAG: hypothetical protein PF495_15770, partial [Spirochaetales bacterium]|nr:hypothetical protein [Spirochaetales bacterium]